MARLILATMGNGVRFAYVNGDRLLATITDTRHPGSVFDPAGGRWAVYCEQHGAVVNTTRLEIAKTLARHTAEFCEVCSGVDMHAYDGGGQIGVCAYV